MRILFVCTGNTCRSAMAEAIFREMVDSDDLEIFSAGFMESGRHASENAIRICAGYGIDLSNHLSSYVGQFDVDKMDLVLTTTEYHRDILRMSHPNADIYTIKEYAGGYDNVDIADPINGDLSVYEECFLEIRQALEKICEKIVIL